MDIFTRDLANEALYHYYACSRKECQFCKYIDIAKEKSKIDEEVFEDESILESNLRYRKNHG